MTSPVTQTMSGNVAVITIDNPPVNALGQAVRAGLLTQVTAADLDPAVTAIVLIGAGRTFPAGADIAEFGGKMLEPALPDVINRIEACNKPVIAALHGTALGGGFEIALGSHYRIADATAKVGLPEVHLGIFPGAGGTQRLPRITGAAPALDMMISGKPINADKALALGIIDKIADGDLLTAALEFASQVTDVRRTSERGHRGPEPTVYAETRAMIDTKMPHLLAPYKMVDCIEDALSDMPFAEGLQLERERFFECLNSPQSAGMVHAFFAERASGKVPEAGRAKPRALNSLGVVGGGTMGAGITVAALDNGLPVVMIERDAEAAAKGRANVEKVFDRNIAKGRMTADQKTAVLANYSVSTNYADLADVDMVIEAVFERIDVKQAVFRELDTVMKPGAVLATNTSYLDISKIAEVTERPQDVIGLHFFSPANIMKLLEIVVADGVADDVVATGFALAKRLRKVPVRAGNSDGFIGNRILAAYGKVAGFMVEDGADPYAVDAAILDFGYPMGIHAMYDLAGLDIGWDNRKAAAPTRDPNARYVHIADKICEQGWFGQKTGRGFYLYPDGARKGVPDPEILAIIDTERAAKRITPRQMDKDEIIRRYLAAMVNEGAKVLTEGVALKPSDIDVTALYGYGFPRFRGGPMKYADMYGLDRLLADIQQFEQEDPLFWKPAPLLVDLVNNGENFDTLNKRAAGQ